MREPDRSRAGARGEEGRRGVAPVKALAAAMAVATLAGCQPSRGAPEIDACALDQPGAPWLAFVSRRSGSYDLYVARADGTCERPLNADASIDLAPTWGTTGSIAFASDRGGLQRVWLHDLASGRETMLDTGTIAAAAPSFSPDGLTIAFEGRPAGATTVDVFVVPAAGGTPTPLTSHAADDTGPAWAPDGRRLYFLSSRTGAFEVFSVPAEGGEATQVTTGSKIIGRPVASPDGSALYFARRATGSTTEVVRFELATKVATPVTGAGESEPALSPDGTLLATRSLRYDDRNPEVVVSAIDGSAPVRVTRDPSADGAPVFAP
jgi:TolB protein